MPTTPESLDEAPIPVPLPAADHEEPPSYSMGGYQHSGRIFAYHPYGHLLDVSHRIRQVSLGNIPTSVRAAGASDRVAACHPSRAVDTVPEQHYVVDGFVVRWGDDWSCELQSLVDYSDTSSAEECDVGGDSSEIPQRHAPSRFVWDPVHGTICRRDDGVHGSRG